MRPTLAGLATVTSLVFITPSVALDIQPESGSGWTDKTSVTAREFMVSAAHPAATQVGYDVLKSGGNAIDAMVAVQFMLNLVEPQSSGIGGGAFLLYWDAATQKLITYDGRETAPAAATPDYFLDESGKPLGWWETVTGGRSVGVPGTLKLLETTHREHGNLSWKSLLEPSVKLAREGFAVSPRLAKSIQGAKENGLNKFDTARDYFFDSNGDALTEGTILKNPRFADLLAQIADQESDVFYNGETAKKIVNAVTKHGERVGLITLNDLSGYQVKKRPPVCQAYRRWQICGMGPPSSGALTVGQILGLLEHFDLTTPGYSTESIHLYSEAAKLAYADRATYMADSDFVPMPVAGLLDPAYLTQRAQLIFRDTAMAKAAAGNPPWRERVSYSADESLELPGTSHFSIVDKDGNIVSITTTIETGFGSRLMVDGFLLNNELTDFSFFPEKNGRPVANRVQGGKRPRSSMAPTIVFDKNQNPVLVIGSPGGSRIINYVAKTIIAVLDWDMDIQQAINLGHFVNRNGVTDLELDTLSAEFKTGLEALGHEIKIRDLNSGLHGIVLNPDGSLTGGADPRREGVVLGD